MCNVFASEEYTSPTKLLSKKAHGYMSTERQASKIKIEAPFGQPHAQHDPMDTESGDKKSGKNATDKSEVQGNTLKHLDPS